MSTIPFLKPLIDLYSKNLWRELNARPVIDANISLLDTTQQNGDMYVTIGSLKSEKG